MVQDDQKAKFKAQTAEQFEALGRFVQTFELMVDAISDCFLFLSQRRVREARTVSQRGFVPSKHDSCAPF